MREIHLVEVKYCEDTRPGHLERKERKEKRKTTQAAKD